ncbi:sensor domain-containing diguanylate cyclase [Alicyclobacillus tolerans]|uniref:sensor domain-containing diguanylate cyclase n=1 Tax=Alicyclobacillus tolerans TaxID=90970 RepID=UPI001F421690|nr:sensor domain-containing diguanylate cyclase [Alicyclobacillus tolerans]MCF8568107.1 sensor domain-containing diguanylate cyclase [Alicyclobacillus tolerans]
MNAHNNIKMNNLQDTVDQVLKILGEFIGVNTLFVAVNDENINFILNAFNRNEVLIEAGEGIPLAETYCNLVTKNATRPVVIESTKTDTRTSGLDVTSQLGNACFIGVPIVLSDNTVCGTICGLDNRGYEYSERDIELLQTMATLLGYVVELERFAFRDGLTHAFNRNFIYMYLTKEWKNRFDTVAFLFVDVDDFKSVNDTYGHVTGDQLLAELSRRIHRCIRRSDMVCRIGGDEFVVVIPNYDSIATVTRIVHSMLTEFETPISVHGDSLIMSASIGVSLYPDDGSDIDALLEQADVAMYQAKHGGKANYQIYSHGMNKE